MIELTLLTVSLSVQCTPEQESQLPRFEYLFQKAYPGVNLRILKGGGTQCAGWSESIYEWLCTAEGSA